MTGQHYATFSVCIFTRQRSWSFAEYWKHFVARLLLPSVLWHCWLGGRKGIRSVKNGGWWRWALVSSAGVAPSRMVSVSASVNLPLHDKVQKFFSGTGLPGWFRKKGPEMDVCVCVVARLNDIHAFGYNSAGSERIWMKFGALQVYCLELALTDFGRDPHRSESWSASRFFCFFLSGK